MLFYAYRRHPLWTSKWVWGANIKSHENISLLNLHISKFSLYTGNCIGLERNVSILILQCDYDSVFYSFTLLDQFIGKICPCNEYPLKPHFYIVKLGHAGVYLFFLFLLQNINCGYSLELPCRGGSKEYPQSMF